MNNPITWIELVRECWPGISDGDAESVLFNATCFPFGTVEQVQASLREKYAQSGGIPERALAIAIEEIDAAMAELRAREDVSVP